MVTPESYARDFVHAIERDKYQVCQDRRWWDGHLVPRDRIPPFHHIRLNTKKFVNAITIDIDDPLAGLHCYEMPDRALLPNILVQSENGHGHATFFLERPVALNDPKMYRLVRDIKRRLELAIPGADHAYNNAWTKTPTHEGWYVRLFNKDRHDLRVIGASQWLPSLPYEPYAAPVDYGDASFEEGSRNIDLFNVLRTWCYQNCVSDFDEILGRGEEVNAQMAKPLTQGEVTSVAKSISKFMVQRFGGKPRRWKPSWQVGVLGLAGSAMPIAERRLLGAAHAHVVVTERSRAAVKAARTANPHGSVSEIARVLDMSRPTVRKYWE